MTGGRDAIQKRCMPVHGSCRKVNGERGVIWNFQFPAIMQVLMCCVTVSFYVQIRSANARRTTAKACYIL